MSSSIPTSLSINCLPLPGLKTISCEKGTILYHQRIFGGVFVNGGDYPYAPVNWFSNGQPYYEAKGTKYNTYTYIVRQEISNIAIISEDEQQSPEDLHSYLIRNYRPKRKFAASDFRDAYNWIPLMQKCGFNGIKRGIEWILFPDIISHHLILVEKTIIDSTVPNKEIHGEYPI